MIFVTGFVHFLKRRPARLGYANPLINEYKGRTANLGLTLLEKVFMEQKKPRHIFIVENNKIFVNLLDYIFSKNILYRFLDFTSGEDCLKNMHLNPEIVVLDFRLTGMNGFETLQEIRELNQDVYVLMLIGENDGKLPAELLNAGANDYVLKDGAEIPGIIAKIEDLLVQQNTGKRASKAGSKPAFRKKLYYALILLLLASAGLYYYQ